ncbi:MAG: hypothetical protein QXJ64_08410 [Thermosphaera sp.]
MCRTQVKLKLVNACCLILNSVGNRYAMVLGDHLATFQAISMLLDLDYELL